jgi:hypothetical protein
MPSKIQVSKSALIQRAKRHYAAKGLRIVYDHGRGKYVLVGGGVVQGTELRLANFLREHEEQAK